MPFGRKGIAVRLVAFCGVAETVLTVPVKPTSGLTAEFPMAGNRHCSFWLKRAAILQIAASLLVVGTLPSASAFELFGIHLFGKKKAVEVVEPVRDPVQYDVTLSVDDPELESLLQSVSILWTKKDTLPSGTIGLLTRARNDKRRLIAALFSTAHYGGTVSIMINGRPFELVPIDSKLERGGTAHVVIHILSGPVFTFAQPSAQTTDGQPIDLSDYGITSGEVARSELVVETDGKLVRAWRNMGYAFAKVVDRTMTADHTTSKLDVSVLLDPGPKAIFGAVTVTGTKDVDPDFVIQQANIPQGGVFSPKRLAAAGKRLRALGVFNSVVMNEAEAPGPDGTVAINIEVSERKPRTFGVGATAATNDGLGAEAFWLHRNLFGRAESLRLEADASGVGRSNFSTSLDYHVAAIFTKPGVWGPTTTFRSRLEADLEDTDAFKKTSVNGNVGLVKIFNEQLTGEVGLDVEYAQYEDTNGPSESLIVSTPMEIVYDTRDNKLDPTSGYRMLFSGAPAYDTLNNVAFFKTQAAFSAYRALNESGSFVLAGRVAAGTIVGADLTQVPADRRFYAGGGGSIRGYAYQAAGPRDNSNLPTGGLSKVEASIEARLKLTESFGLAAFIDSGGAFSTSMPGQGGLWYTGVGAGIRYLTPVGPLRLDVAVPLKKISGEPSFGVYIGLGQAF